MNEQVGTPVHTTNNKKPNFGRDDIITIVLLIFLFPIGVLVMWFATKWPKWLKFLITIPFILGVIGLIIAFLILNVLAKNDLHDNELPKTPDQVFCTQEAKLCPDGRTYVSREGPNCEFQECPTVEPEDATPSSEVTELPQTRSETFEDEQAETLPTASE